MEPTTLQRVELTRCPHHPLFQDIDQIILYPPPQPTPQVCLATDPLIYPVLLTTLQPNTVAQTIATVVGAHLQYLLETQIDIQTPIKHRHLYILQEHPHPAHIEVTEITDQ